MKWAEEQKKRIFSSIFVLFTLFCFASGHRPWPCISDIKCLRTGLRVWLSMLRPHLSPHWFIRRVSALSIVDSFKPLSSAPPSSLPSPPLTRLIVVYQTLTYIYISKALNKQQQMISQKDDHYSTQRPLATHKNTEITVNGCRQTRG